MSLKTFVRESFLNQTTYAVLGIICVVVGALVAGNNRHMSDIIAGLVIGIAGSSMLLGAAILRDGGE